MTGLSKGSPWTRDSFLEQCLGYPVFRLNDISSARAVIQEATVHAKWMIEARVPVDRVADLASLTAHGFRVIDTNVQLMRAPSTPADPPHSSCRFATASDERAVRDIAASAFSQTRFHLDPRIPRDTANRIKEQWAGNFFIGRRGEWMVVAEHEGTVSGFSQVLRGQAGTLVIDLIAVAAGARGKQLATAMIDYAALTCLGRPAALVVGTQIGNVGSLALYSRNGFRIASANYVLHLHEQDATP